MIATPSANGQMYWLFDRFKRLFNLWRQRWLLLVRNERRRQRQDGFRLAAWAISTQANASWARKCLCDVSECNGRYYLYGDLATRTSIFGRRRHVFTNAVAAYWKSRHRFKVGDKDWAHLETEDIFLSHKLYRLPWANDTPRNTESRNKGIDLIRDFRPPKKKIELWSFPCSLLCVSTISAQFFENSRACKRETEEGRAKVPWTQRSWVGGDGESERKAHDPGYYSLLKTKRKTRNWHRCLQQSSCMRDTTKRRWTFPKTSWILLLEFKWLEKSEESHSFLMSGSSMGKTVIMCLYSWKAIHRQGELSSTQIKFGPEEELGAIGELGTSFVLRSSNATSCTAPVLFIKHRTLSSTCRL